MTPERLSKIMAVAEKRTSKVCLVLEDVRHPHNISACLRTAEAFGVQNIHVVEGKHRFKPSSVTRGVDRWVDISTWSSSEELVKSLKAHGYRLAAAYPSSAATPIDSLPVEHPLAIVFGNEGEGLSSPWAELSDVQFTIPMVGMVESLNISVSCALSLRSVVERMKLELGNSFFLEASERERLVSRWMSYRRPCED